MPPFFHGGFFLAKRQKSVRFVSRGGDKLDGALTDWSLDVSGLVAADLGSNVGGFTDCLLQRGAGRVYAVDTGYGVLDWTLRQDERVVVMERTNALHVVLPESVDLVVADVGWTSMARVVPVALSLVKDSGMVVALLKPQYEALENERSKGVVRADCIAGVVHRVKTGLVEMGFLIVDCVDSKVPGSGGNHEFFLLLKRE